MSKPAHLDTNIFLDGGDPHETESIKQALGWLDGQTTNPSLVAAHPDFQACAQQPEGCRSEDLWAVYRTIVTDIAPLVEESVSIEVYADQTTPAASMIEEGRQLNTWIPNAHIKLPINAAGLEAAETLVGEGIRVNMTLCFTQAQVAAVYAATRGAAPGDVYISPFVGRLDDRGQDGMSFITNVITMLRESDGHVQPLVASVRSLAHLRASIACGAPLVTAPGSILREWADAGLPLPDESYIYDAGEKKSIPYEEFDLTADWREFDITHPLTSDGIDRFAADWNAVLK